MSYQFNDTDTYAGLVQQYERACGFPRGTISGDTDRLKEFAADVNEAMGDYLTIALPASGTWQLDDSNHDDYPIIRGNIVSGQRDYTFTTDGSGNLILDLLRVRILQSATATEYADIVAIDDPSVEFSNLHNAVTGVPSAYDKLGNGIRFDTIPNYSATAGLELHINREASLFSYDDTTKKPGVPGLHHKYFYLKPAFKWARDNDATRYATLAIEVQKMEGKEELGLIGSIARYFGKRSKDERQIMTPKLTPKL